MALSSARQNFFKILSKVQNNHVCSLRNFQTSIAFRVRRIVEREEGKVTVIQAENVESPHAGKVLQSSSPGCPICRLNLPRITHDDVLILSQFLGGDGEILPAEVTKLCPARHKEVQSALYQAQRIGLINSEKHKPKERWQELNNYFGRTDTKVDFGKPKIRIQDFLKRPKKNVFWKEDEEKF